MTLIGTSHVYCPGCGALQDWDDAKKQHAGAGNISQCMACAQIFRGIPEPPSRTWVPVLQSLSDPRRPGVLMVANYPMWCFPGSNAQAPTLTKPMVFLNVPAVEASLPLSSMQHAAVLAFAQEFAKEGLPPDKMVQAVLAYAVKKVVGESFVGGPEGMEVQWRDRSQAVIRQYPDGGVELPAPRRGSGESDADVIQLADRRVKETNRAFSTEAAGPVTTEARPPAQDGLAEGQEDPPEGA